MKTLYRSETNKMVGGVCGGLGDYFSIDPTLIRLLFILLTIGEGAGILIYLILWLLLPSEHKALSADGEVDFISNPEEFAGRAREMGDELREAVSHPNPQSTFFIGAALILIGIVFLVDNLNITWLRWLDFGVLWPLAVIAVGVVLIIRRVREE